MPGSDLRAAPDNPAAHGTCDPCLGAPRPCAADRRRDGPIGNNPRTQDVVRDFATSPGSDDATATRRALRLHAVALAAESLAVPNTATALAACRSAQIARRANAPPLELARRHPAPDRLGPSLRTRSARG